MDDAMMTAGDLWRISGCSNATFFEWLGATGRYVNAYFTAADCASLCAYVTAEVPR